MSGQSGHWGDLRARLFSGIGMAVIALACLIHGGIAWRILLFIVAVGLAVEWGLLIASQSPARPKAPGTALLAACIGVAVIAFITDCPQAALAVLVFGLLALLAWTRKPLLALGIPCIGAAVIALLWLRADPVAGLANVLFVVVVVCSSDIGAYLAGRAIGGRKLAPAISPGKTISGAVGGLFAAALAGVAVAAWASPVGQTGSPAHAAILAILFAMVAQAGDLAESWLKRRVGAKDSSHLIPGHGGLLDRLDALLAVAPVAAILALTLGRGVVLWQ